MGLSTKDLGTGSGLPKTISPGNHILKLNSISLEDFTFIDGAYHLMLHVETKPIDDFVGFFIDKDDESKGNYEGQIGRIKGSKYAFADGETKSGIKIQRDRSILIFLQNLCKTLDINEWFLGQDGKNETIEDFINSFNKCDLYKNKYMEYCVAGKEYLNNAGYVNHDLWLPKAEKGKYSIGGIEEGKVIHYNEELHLTPMTVVQVSKFGDDDDFTNAPKTSTDFNLD